MHRFLPQSLITRLERLLRIDLRYAVSGGFFLTLTQVTSAVASLALTIAFANLLPVETYGTYRYVLAVYALLAIAALPGIDTAVLKSISRGKDSSFDRGVTAKLQWGLLGTLASILFATYQFIEGSFIMGSIFVIAGIALPFMESFSLYGAIANGKKLFRTWAIIEISIQIVSVTALIATMILTKNIIAVMLAYFLPYVLCRAVATWHLRKRIEQTGSDDDLFSYGRSLTVFQVITRVVASLDQIVLYHFLGPAQVAIFSLATAIPNRVQSLLRITGTLAFPKFANQTSHAIAHSLPRKMLLFTLGILGISIVYVLLAPYIFTYVFPKYLPSLLYSQVAVFYTLSAITYPFASYLFAHKKIKENYLIAIGSFIVKVLCLVFLVPVFGIWGAIAGLLATSLLTIILAFGILYIEARNPSIDSA